MKYIKSLLALALTALLGTSAWAADETGTLNLCVGDQVNIYESHGSAYTLAINTEGSSSVATGSLPNGTSCSAGKFYTIDAVGVGTTTIEFQSSKTSSGKTTTAKRTFTVNVSAARVIPVNGTADVTGWGSSSEGGSTTWTPTVTPSGYVTVNVTTGTKTAMAATLTGKTVGSGTVKISDVPSNAGTECIFAVTVSNDPIPEAVKLEPDGDSVTKTHTGTSSSDSWTAEVTGNTSCIELDKNSGTGKTFDLTITSKALSGSTPATVTVKKNGEKFAIYTVTVADKTIRDLVQVEGADSTPTGTDNEPIYPKRSS